MNRKVIATFPRAAAAKASQQAPSVLDFPTVVDVACHRAQELGDQHLYTYLVDGEAQRLHLSYAALDRRARAIAASLQRVQAGGQPVERALLLYEPGLDLIAGLFGCLYARVVAVLVYPPDPARLQRSLARFEATARDARPSVILATAATQALAAAPPLADDPALAGVPWLATDEVPDELARDWRRPAIHRDDVALLQYTSGSTSDPRGVMVTHGNLLHNEMMVREAIPVGDDTVSLGWLPPYHDMGLMGSIFRPLFMGRPSIFMSPLAFVSSPSRWLQAISRHRATMSGAPSFAYDLAARRVTRKERSALDLSGWRVAFVGAEPVHAETLDRFVKAFAPCGFRAETFFPSWGLAELTVYGTGGPRQARPVIDTVRRSALERGSVEAAGADAAGTRRIVSCGQPPGTARLLVVDPQSRRPCARNQVGEIWVAGPHVAAGYWADAERTAEVFGARLANGGGPFLRTGDLGYVRDGQLFVTGRLKDVIVLRGRNHYPHDIERAVGRRGHPAVRPGSAAAFSLEVNGEERLAFVQEVRLSHDGSPEEIVELVRQAVAEDLEINVDVVALVPPRTLPKTSSGKLARGACRSALLQGDLGVVHLDPPDAIGSRTADGPAVESEASDGRAVIEASVRRLAAGALGVKEDEVQADRALTGLGLDSLRAVELASALELNLGVDVPLAELFAGATLADLVERALERDGAAAATRTGPAVVTPDPAARHEPFPLNELQQAYWAGRAADFDLGNVATHAYLEVDTTALDLERLQAAWRRVIDRHDMLRAVVTSDGRQRILESVPDYQIEVTDLRGAAAAGAELNAIRERLSHQVLPFDRWPLFEVRATRLDRDRTRLHVSVDLLIADARSLFVVLRDWARFYQQPDLDLSPPALSFRDYVLAAAALRDSEPYQRSLDWWRQRLAGLPPSPQLPFARNLAAIDRPRFRRRAAELDGGRWRRLKEHAASRGLTPSALLCAAFAEVIRTWSADPRFTLNLTMFNRQPLHPEVDQLAGEFTSMIPLEVDAAPGSFQHRAERLQQRLTGALEHRYVSGVRLLREYARARGDRTGAQLPVVFTSVLEDLATLDWLGDLTYMVTQTPQVALDQQVFERSGALVLSCDAVDELFPAGVVEAMLDAYTGFLARLADDDTAWQERRPRLVPESQLALRRAVNATAAPLPDELLHGSLARHAGAEPERPAVIARGRSLTYGQLHRAANGLARVLRAEGTEPGQPVAVVMEKGWEQVVAALAVLHAGSPYVPVDPALPTERRWHLLQRAGTSVALTQPRLVHELEWPGSVSRTPVGEETLAELDGDLLEPAQRPGDPAYILYTSGSTGTPKGVAVPHRGALNTILAINRLFGVREDDRVFGVSSLSFDLSVYDVFGALAAGATLVLPEERGRRDPAHWAEVIRQERVTVWNSVPTLMELLAEHAAARGDVDLRSLRLVLFSGDWIPVALPDRVRAVAPDARVIGLGGPTETSIWSVVYPIDDIDPHWKSIPYGKPLPNQRLYVLDEDLGERPVWVPGEIFIAGLGLATGYWRDEELTAGSFISHPHTGERLYRSGDLGRCLPDGNIEILGRVDFQVKLHGQRIELGEIEATLETHPDVRQAVVVAAGDGPGKRLAAYVVSQPAAAPDPTGLRPFLKAKLPEYMLPSTFSVIDDLPLNANNKVDRRALAATATTAATAPEAQPADLAGVTGRIQKLVANLVGRPQVGLDANLDDLGATSVDLIMLARRLEEELGFRPAIDDLYPVSTIRELAKLYLASRPAAAPSAPGELGIDAHLAAFEGLIDPGQREAFRKSRPGLRSDTDAILQVRLRPLADERLPLDPSQRRSWRRFSPEPVTAAMIGRLLGCLRQDLVAGEPRHLYPSAGGLYPVQAYLHVKPGRVNGVGAGAYYYHPGNDEFLLLEEAELDRGIHWPANRQIFDSAAFSILLVADLQAIEPLYGGLSRDFCLVEAGAVAQLLQSAAPACGLGLCPIGYLNVERVRPLLHLHDRHEFLHALVGGRLLTDVHGSATGSLTTTVPSRTAGATALASAARTEQGQ